MADNHDLLQHLADIYEPELAQGFQPALGHYMLFTLVLLALSALAFWLYRRYQQGAAKRAALAELAALDWQAPSSVATLNQLLKRLLRHYHPTDPLLYASTEQWQAFLAQRLPPEQNLPTLSTLLYQPPEQISPQVCQQWWQACQIIVRQLHPVHGFYRTSEAKDA